MTPNNQSIDNSAAPEDTTPEDTAAEDTASQNQSVGNEATENEPTASITRPRDWILYLPPEIRMSIFRHLLQLPFHLPYNLPLLLVHPHLQTLIGIFRTSRLIRRESIDVFYRDNVFYRMRTFRVRTWYPRFTVVPSWRIGDMIQNLAIDMQLSRPYRALREQFINMINAFGDPAIVLGTPTVLFFFVAHLRHRWDRGPLHFFLGGLGRFTNFQIVNIHVRPLLPPALTNVLTQVVNPLRLALGPANPHDRGYGLTFLPQRFLNTRSSRQNIDFIDQLAGIHLDSNRDETNDE